MAECGGDLDCEYKTYMRYRELSIAHNDELIACGDDAVCIQKHLDKMYSIDGGLGEVSFPVGYGEFTDLQTSALESHCQTQQAACSSAFNNVIIDTTKDLQREFLVNTAANIGLGGFAFIRGKSRVGRGADDAVVTNYGPLTLSSEVTNTFRSGTYSKVVTSEPTTLYRVYGGSSDRLGPYWSRTKPSGPDQAIVDSALDPQWGNTATNVVTIQVPARTTFYEGAAAGQRGLVGGGNQVYFNTNVSQSWIVD